MEQDFFGNVQTPFRAVNNKVIVPSDEEIARNLAHEVQITNSRKEIVKIMEQQNTTSQQESDSHITLKSILGGDILPQFSGSDRRICSF